MLHLVLIFWVTVVHAYEHRHHLSCDKHSNSIAMYRLTLETTWTQDRFPKQFPEIRPNAQWSTMIGRSHNDDYELWSKGGIASPGFKQFAESGQSSILDSRETQGFNGVHDSFMGAPMKTGAGTTQVDFFTSHNHSMVSLATRMIPSPDWFIGISGFDLCRNGTWTKSIKVKVDPHDAGTDKGFTFSSPNWASRPQEKIYEITSQHPDHIANSFYYPELQELPSIGHVHFKLVTVFKHEHTVHHVSHWRQTQEDEVSLAILERRREELEEKLILAGEPIAQDSNESPRKSDLNELASDRSAETREARTRNMRVPVSHRQIQELLPVKVKKNVPEKKRGRQDCRVGEWSAWSSCSKTCGFGAQKRYRKVTQIPRGGLPCPDLDQQKWCGSMRSCRTSGKTSLFSWVDNGDKDQEDE